MNKYKIELEQLINDIDSAFNNYDRSIEKHDGDYPAQAGVGGGTVNVIRYYIEQVEKRLNDE